MPPRVVTTIEETRHTLASLREAKKSIGFVPTMGALHEGHASLFRQAKAANDIVVVSIFVNPTQFGPNEDFHKYPRPLEKDIELCAAAGVDLIFHPTPAGMYPEGFQTFVDVETLQKPLCGITRPTHFRGVVTVVLKLFNIVQPDRAYFGQKDAQQARLLLQMVRDLDVPVAMVICPIVREADGLAMSSRNKYLSAEQRSNAVVLQQALAALRTRIEAGERNTATLRDLAVRMIEATPGAKLDYVEIVDWEAFRPMHKLNGKVLVALAVFFGTTRLIDNWLSM